MDPKSFWIQFGTPRYKRCYTTRNDQHVQFSGLYHAEGRLAGRPSNNTVFDTNGVSTKGGTPKWTVYNVYMDDLEVPRIYGHPT